MRLRTLSVKELSSYIAQSINLDQILKNIHVEGEISNFKIHSTGNIYFSLKDERSKINCIMFENYVDVNFHNQKISEGDKVVCQGSVNYYDKEGYINLIVSNIQRVGEGQAYQDFLRLKKQLMAEGLFDEKHKVQIPSFPKQIGIVTSPTGAVIRDIYHVIMRRYPKVELIVYPAKVQGEGSAQEVSEGIRYFQESTVDTIIIARGGGSYEDLSAFNDEELAHVIFASKKPVISAVGHETDFTIADFVADVRASTPSVAAELAVPKLDDIYRTLDIKLQDFKKIIDSKLGEASSQVEKNRHVLDSKSPLSIIKSHEEQLLSKREILKLRIGNMIHIKEALLEQKVNAIFLKNPNAVYDMGGAYLTDEFGHKVASVEEVDKKMKLEASLKDGKFIVEVLEMI